MPVVARVREQSELQRALQRARSGVGGLVRVVGEPGIGKTTLVRALFELARSQDIRAGWARPWRGSPPFALVVDVLRSCHPSAGELVTALGKYASGLGTLFPELGGDSEGDRSKQSLFAALAGWLRSCEPTLLVLDDAHEADLASLECLTWLAPSLTGSRVLIVVSERSVGRDASPESEAYLSRWLRVSETLNLGPLDTRAVGQMLEWHSGNLSSSELHEKVTALTRGNPLFVEGVAHALEAGASLAHLGQAVSADLRGSIDAWLGALGTEARGALAAASLLSREFSVDLLAQILDRGPEFVGRYLEQAEREMLVVKRTNQYEFRHPLLAEMLSAMIDAPERARLHARIADVLFSYFGDTSASRIAYHRVRAVAVSGVEVAVVSCERAATQALAVFGYSDAAEHWRTAVTLLGGEAGSAATQRRARLELERAQALLRAGKRAGARQIIDDIWPTLYATSPDAAVRAALLTAATGEFGGLDRVKLERLELALGAAVDEGDKIRLQARLAAELWVEPAALARRLHLSDEALAAARKLGDPELVFQVIDDRCQALFGTGRDDERQALAEELRQRAHGVEQGLSASRRAMSVLLQRGEFARFAREVENFSGQSRTLRQSSLEEDALQRLQLVATLQGDLGRALGLIEQTRRLGHEIENPQAEMGYRFTRGWIAQLRGEREVLASIASEFEGDAARLPNLPFIRSYWALCHAAAGQLDAARLQLSRYMGELFPALPHDLARTASLAFATECAVLIDAREALEQLLPCLSRELGPFVSVGSTLCYGALEYFVGIAQLALGNLEAALEALGLADRLHEQSGSPTLQWRSVWALARLEQRTRASRDVSASTLARLHALGKHLAIATPNSEPAPRPADPEPGEQTAELRRQGTGWTLNWSGKLYVLPDAKGVGLLAILLEAPGRRVHVLDLVDAGELKREGQGAPVLDKRALAAYRLRRTELRQIEQDAAGAGDMTAAHAARAEREAIEDALKTALGLGGRARASGSAERARSAVGKALKRALQTVVDVCAEAGAHLTRGVRTGTFCVYDPDPAIRVFWTIQR